MTFERVQKKTIRTLFYFSNLYVFRLLYWFPVLGMLDIKFFRNITDWVWMALAIWWHKGLLSFLIVDKLKGMFCVIGERYLCFAFMDDTLILAEYDGWGPKEFAISSHLFNLLWRGKPSLTKSKLPVIKCILCLLHLKLFKKYSQSTRMCMI